MLIRWLKRRLQLAAIRGGRADLDRFLASLRGMADDEIASLVAMAAISRIVMRRHNHLPDWSLAIVPAHRQPEQARIQWKVSGAIRDMQSQGMTPEAAAAMVWLHSLRALTTPELRFLGREMWLELQRGFPGATIALAHLMAIGKAIPDEAWLHCRFIPPDLAP